MNNELQFLIYNTPDEKASVNAVIGDETIWLTQKAIAELFGCSPDNISLHLKNIFADGELDKNSVTEEISAPAKDGKKYLTQFYNLDAIISLKTAEEKAYSEYETFNKTQKINSDFEKSLRLLVNEKDGGKHE